MIKLKALHHARFGSPDVVQTEQFARDFGLHRVEGEWPAIYMRGAGTDAYHYVLEKADRAKFIALAFEVESMDDLKQAVEAGGTPIAPLTGPGGGHSVTLHDPDGLRIDLVFGIRPREADAPAKDRVHNFGSQKRRLNTEQRLDAKGPPDLLRLGHAGIYIKNYPACGKWYQEVLGLVPSDLLYIGNPKNLVGGFFRLNRGDEYVDHHVLFMAALGKSDLHHISFEVHDFEAQFMGHAWMKDHDRELVWGVGRHPLGCHIFDVWMDPNGYRLETFSDTDQFNMSYQTRSHELIGMPIDTWSDGPPEKYFGPMPMLGPPGGKPPGAHAPDSK